jgi:outer membrane protein assembly factor BamB
VSETTLPQVSAPTAASQPGASAISDEITEPLELEGDISVIDLVMNDGTRHAVVFPSELAGREVALSENVVGAAIEGVGFTADLFYSPCDGDQMAAGSRNVRGAILTRTDSGIVVCRSDQFLVLEVATDRVILDEMLDSFDVVPIEIGPQYASRTFASRDGVCCDAFGPLSVGDLVVTANRFTSGVITAWDAETLAPRWTTDLGVSTVGDPASLLLGVAGDLVLATPGTDRVVALDAASGEIHWEVPIQGATIGVVEDPSGDVWYVTSDFRCEGCSDPPQVTAINVNAGLVRWTTEGVPRTRWQWGDPVVFPGMVVVMDVGGHWLEGEPAETGRVRAFDTDDGSAIWTTDLDSPSQGFSSHLLLADPERLILIAATPDGSVFRVDPRNGDVLWRVDTGFARLVSIDEDTVTIQQVVPTALDLETGEPA